MNWMKRSGVFVLCLGAMGCATSAHRETNGLMSSRSPAWSRTTAPRQSQVSLPPEQPDLFAATAPRTDKYRLAHYFPGLARPAGGTAAVGQAGQGALTTPVAPTDPVLAASSYRPSWFGFRKPRTTQTYMTDTRSATSTRPVEPSVLPIALQLPTRRVADSSVTPTAVELPQPTTEAPSNPDASTAAATPLSTTEPQLAVKPFGAAGGEASEAEAGANPTPAETGPATETPATEALAADPRERPRLPATLVDSSGASKDDAAPAATAEDAKPADEAKPAAPQPEPEPEPAIVRPSAADSRAVKATPSVADPDQSLGLPPATMPASYNQHQSIAVRGSTQGQQPPPILASPQFAASPQSQVTPTAATKTWRRPCLRRLVRRMCHLGEFATPPTAKPH